MRSAEATGRQFLLDFSLDDALVLSLRLDPLQKTLALTLYAGDAQRGYFKLLLHYDNIALTRAETQLLCLIVHAADDIYWGELDIVEGDEPLVFIHRLLWHSSIKMDRDGCCFQPEIELRFGGFELEVTPLPDGRTAKRDTDFIQVVGDPDYIEGLN